MNINSSVYTLVFGGGGESESNATLHPVAQSQQNAREEFLSNEVRPWIYFCTNDLEM